MPLYELDLTGVPNKKIYPLGSRFSGTAPDGRSIGFTNVTMTVDGRPFFGISGEMHFSRVAPDQWEDAVIKMRCGGINILSTYVFWIVHEEEEGVFRFDGCRDLNAFLQVCEKHGMMVIVRLGPFCHGEVRNGGLPDWLYGKPWEVRENDPGFLSAVRRFFRAVHGQLNGHYFGQGGCVIGAQVENEYMHSSAPWEITTGISDEWVNGGRSGDDYMLALKRIMTEEGIVTPFYTATAWGGASAPADELLPMWGGYSYQPWLFYKKTGVHPATPEYIYRDNHNSAVKSEYNFAPAWDPESRPYALCEMMGGMMCTYKYRFLLDMRAVDALANIKLGSGCGLLGYYMYRGGTTPLGLRTPYLNECQVPKRSYDYQAAIGEYGQIRESYGRLRAIHMLCGQFTGLLSQARTVLPGHLRALKPEDPGPLRFAVRAKGGSGFLFINNFQDHMEMSDRHGDEVRLRLPRGETVFRFDIAKYENAILPFGIDLGGARLDWATAQPITKVGGTWFFLGPDGMEPVYCIDGQTVRARRGEAFRHRQTTIMTLSRRDSLAFWAYEGSAWLSEKPLLWDGRSLFAETDGMPADVLRWDEDEGRFLPFAHLDERQGPMPVPWRTVGAGRYVIDLPRSSLRGHKLALLRVRCLGDIGHAFCGNELISDCFLNGAPWDIRVDDLKDAPLTLYVTPTRTNITVDASAMAGLTEKADTAAAALVSAELIVLDDVIIGESSPFKGDRIHDKL